MFDLGRCSLEKKKKKDWESKELKLITVTATDAALSGAERTEIATAVRIQSVRSLF